MFGRLFSYKLELNFELDEVRLAFPELDDAFPDANLIELTSKNYAEAEEAMDALNGDAQARITRLMAVNPEHDYRQIKVVNPSRAGVPDADLTDEDREFWTPDKLTILMGVREDNDEFMYRYTFLMVNESERAVMLQRDMKALPLESQLALVNNFNTTLQ